MAKYINTAMAIEALQKGLYVWIYQDHWIPANIATLTSDAYADHHFATGEKPTSPPRKMIEIDGVRMPAPIMRVEDLPETFYVLCASGELSKSPVKKLWADECQQGSVYATEADAIAARDGWIQVKKQAMERAK